MAGHSQFKNIMYRKGVQDKKRSNLFAKLTREIIVASKEGGTDISSNARLRVAVQMARSSNMPKDNIERAIRKGSGNDVDSCYEYARYEGYGPFGVAVIVDALTNNKNRTASDLRVIFSKSGGTLAEPNAVTFLFERVGKLIFHTNQVSSFEEFFEKILDQGGQDVIEGDDFYTVICPMDRMHDIQKELSCTFGNPRECCFVWNPYESVKFLNEQMVKIHTLIDKLYEHDDVQNIFTNMAME